MYLETTVFNYYFDVDREGHCDTVKLFEAIGTGLHEGYASEYVMAELKRAPEPKRSDMLTLVEKYGIRVIAPSLDAVHLAERYIKNGIIPNAYRFDGVHIAAASIYGLDCVVSYNFKHINRAKTR